MSRISLNYYCTDFIKLIRTFMVQNSELFRETDFNGKYEYLFFVEFHISNIPIIVTLQL